MKKIIVATDFSAEAANATQYAANAAVEQQYELILFNLYNLSVHALNGRISSEALYELLMVNENRLNEAAAVTASSYGVKVTPHFATGNFYEEINKCIQLHNVEIVVMGMASKYLEQELLGDTTTSAIHRLKTPVLAIPLGVRYQGIKHILFACDTVRGVHKSILEKVRAVASGFGAVVEVFHVKEKIEELIAIQDQHERIDEAMTGISYYHKSIESKKVIEAIRQEVSNSKTDLLIMVPYKYGFWSSLIHRSKTRIMASGNNVPLLSISL